MHKLKYVWASQRNQIGYKMRIMSMQWFVQSFTQHCPQKFHSFFTNFFLQIKRRFGALVTSAEIVDDGDSVRFLSFAESIFAVL